MGKAVTSIERDPMTSLLGEPGRGALHTKCPAGGREEPGGQGCWEAMQGRGMQGWFETQKEFGDQKWGENRAGVGT